eukprot:Skav231090  [mRNA]  locus=scaffold524:537812:538405:- [translate_table: standard]
MSSADVTIEVLHSLRRAVKISEQEMIKKNFGLSAEEVRDMRLIVARDNKNSRNFYRMGRFGVAVGIILGAVAGYMTSRGDLGGAMFVYVCVGICMFVGICGLTVSGILKCREESRHVVANKLNSRFPQLRFTISQKKEDVGCCGEAETGWQVVIEKRHHHHHNHHHHHHHHRHHNEPKEETDIAANETEEETVTEKV